MNKLTVVFGRLNDCLRLCLWRGSNKRFTSEGLKVSEYGKVTSFTSPLTLLNKPKVRELLLGDEQKQKVSH